MNPIPASYNDYKLPWGANIEKYSTCEFDFFKKNSEVVMLQKTLFHFYLPLLLQQTIFKILY
jgi:hypothetical protein